MRALTGAHHLALDEAELPLLRCEEPLGLVEQQLGVAVVARHGRERQPRALPRVVVVDLGHGRAHVLEPLLGRAQEVALLLQRAAGGEVELAREDADEAGGHGGIQAGLIFLSSASGSVASWSDGEASEAAGRTST